MFNSLETRCPLLDHRILELAARIPPQLRFKNGINKYIFKKSMREILPDEVVDRPKKGFGIPGHAWLKGDLSELIQEVLDPRNSNKRNLFKPDVAQSILKKNLRFGSNLWPQVWSLLVFELWCQEYLD
ncbi:MAG: asparagine synthase-related protein [bacterium]